MSAARKTGVLLVNLGTPAAPTRAAIRSYLKQFLSDPRVVELPRALWLPLLYGFILPLRPGRLTEAYSKVWTKDGSPLLAHSRRQQAGVQALLGAATPVALAMTYGEPGIAAGIEELQKRGATRIRVLPLYPQYSATTTAAVYDAVFAVLRTQRHLPEVHLLGDYHDHPDYIASLAGSVHEHQRAQGRPDHLLISFHSIPQRCIELGDPYQQQCETTARLLAQALRLEAGRWSVSYQSRLGSQPWVQPYTDKVLPQLAARGVRKVDVICPGFPADCLETLEEVAIRYRELFIASGGGELRYIGALNERADHLRLLAALASA